MKPFVGVAVLVAAVGQVPPPSKEGAALFETKVRPVFAARCVACHKAGNASGGVRLDAPAGWKAAVASGKLLKAVRHEPGAPAMPPTGTKLSARELEGLAEWVQRGAPGPSTLALKKGENHWAFAPLKPSPPAPSSQLPSSLGWKRGTTQNPLPASLRAISGRGSAARNERAGEMAAVRGEMAAVRGEMPIDTLVSTKLAGHGLKPNPPAEKHVWLRRVTFDLIGLPPTPDELKAFLADTSPTAKENVVDRLLASPHFGEKWARHWLDLARFAESHGYEQDYDRPNAYTYRDFVIQAFNNDLPYNTFVKWQLAGDELEPTNPQALFATGFLGAGTHATQITKSQVEKERYDELDDMLSVTSQAFLGLTVGCARCHDHKYDPIPQRDYYRMLSTFTKTVRSDYEVAVDPAGDATRLAAWEAAQVPLVAARAAWEKDKLPERFAHWQATVSVKPVTWLYPKLERAVSAGGATLTPQPDSSVLVTGTNPEHETLTFTLTTTQKQLAALRIEALTHPSLVRGGPGRASNGNFALSNVWVRVEGPSGGFGGIRLVSAKADFEQAGLPVAAAIDQDSVSSWAIDPQFGKDHTAVFVFEKPVRVPPGAAITVRLEFNNNTGHGMGRPRLAFAESATAPLNGLAVADGPEGWRQYYKTLDPEWQALQAAVAAHEAKRPTPSLKKAMICSEGVPAIRTHTQGGDFLEQTHFLKRGDPNQKGEVATQSFLTVLKRADDTRWQAAPPPGWRTTYQRRAFASWITDTEKGAGALAARVMVNRVWQRLFGRGIVATPSDFGTMGERPTHPELLDTLATDFIQSGWRVKPLIKRLVLTQTYGQSATLSAEKAKRDPDNRWLSRFARRRLEAENLRDAMLAVSGQLDPTLYGPGTLDESMKRRGIYFFIKRSRLVPFLVAFDAPNSLQSIGLRQSTTVAPQALILLNNPQARAWAAAFAQRVDAPYAPAESLRRAYLLALSRNPTPAELSDGLAYLNAGGTLTDFCQVLFSLNEFTYVE